MITGINHITLSVRDIAHTFHFYVEVLGLTPIQKNANSCYVTAGSTWIAFDRYDGDLKRPLPDYTHLAFHVAPEDFPGFVARLREAECESWQPNATEGDSFYFLDPDGHKLEIHSTTLSDRIQHGKLHWGRDVTWYVDTASQTDVEQRPINQGDIFWIQPEVSLVAELGYYPHPYVVIQDDLLNHSRIHSVVVSALTSNLKEAKAPGNVLLEVGEANLPKQSVVVVSKVTAVDKLQLGKYIGSLNQQRITQVLAGMRFLQSSFFTP